MVIESLAVANAAYATIKAAVENGRELTSVSKQIMNFATAKQDIERKHNKKKHGFFGTKADNDIEEFFHLEEIRQKEQQLKELFMWYGRPGCCEDYQKHCSQARKARAEAEKKRDALLRAAKTKATGVTKSAESQSKSLERAAAKAAKDEAKAAKAS